MDAVVSLSSTGFYYSELHSFLPSSPTPLFTSSSDSLCRPSSLSQLGSSTSVPQ